MQNCRPYMLCLPTDVAQTHMVTSILIDDRIEILYGSIPGTMLSEESQFQVDMGVVRSKIRITIERAFFPKKKAPFRFVTSAQYRSLRCPKTRPRPVLQAAVFAEVSI